jgi:hypothetical protein
MRRYLAALPDGTVFAQTDARGSNHLVAARDARRLEWFAPNEILHESQPRGDGRAGREFCAARVVWLNTRKELEKAERAKNRQPAGARQLLRRARARWRLAALFAKGDARPRLPSAPRCRFAPCARSREMPPNGGSLSRRSRRNGRPAGKSAIQREWSVPGLRGRLCGRSSPRRRVEACTIGYFTASGAQAARRISAQAMLWAAAAHGFPLPIPTDADACRVQLKFARVQARRVHQLPRGGRTGAAGAF